LEKGAKIGEIDNNGITALLTAAYNGHLAVFQWLLNNGANISDVDYNGNNSLLFASMDGHLEIISYILINYPALSINSRNKNNNSAILLAALNGQLDTIKFLVESGVNINDKGINAAGIFLLAAQNNHINVLKWVIEKSGDKNIVHETNNDEENALHICFKNIIEKVKKMDKDKKTNTVSFEQLTCATFLLNCGVSLVSMDKRGKAPLHYLFDDEICKRRAGSKVEVDPKHRLGALTFLCERKLGEIISNDNFFEYVQLASRFGFAALNMACFEYIINGLTLDPLHGKSEPSPVIVELVTCEKFKHFAIDFLRQCT